MHRTVLLNETIEGLNLNTKSVVIDGTFGGGGHSLEICKRYPGIRIIAIDQDAGTFAKAKKNFKDCNIAFHNTNFRNLEKILQKEGVGGVNGIILDLGLSSDQLENSG